MGPCNAIAIQVSYTKKALKTALHKSYEIKPLNVITAKYTASQKKNNKEIHHRGLTKQIGCHYCSVLYVSAGNKLFIPKWCSE